MSDTPEADDPLMSEAEDQAFIAWLREGDNFEVVRRDLEAVRHALEDKKRKGEFS
jgi:hypothetical protein